MGIIQALRILFSRRDRLARESAFTARAVISVYLAREREGRA